MLSQKEFVEGCYNWYREADLQPGNPEDGDWEEAHYPVPKCKGGTETILLLKEHHAVQGVIQSEELQWRCIFSWEEKYLSGEYLELFNKWMSEGMKLHWANKTEEEKILRAEKIRARAVARYTQWSEEERILWCEKLRAAHAQMPEEKKILKAEKLRDWHAQLTEEEKILRAEKLKATHARMTEEEKILKAERLRAYHAQLTEEEKILVAEKKRAKMIAIHARRRERQAQELLARWKEGCVRDCIL